MAQHIDKKAARKGIRVTISAKVAPEVMAFFNQAAERHANGHTSRMIAMVLEAIAKRGNNFCFECGFEHAPGWHPHPPARRPY